MPEPEFTVGQRVRTTVNAPGAWPGALDLPAGSLGTITRQPFGPSWGYGVTLDDDPSGLAASYDADELTAA
ncbi:hypothetical protein ACGFMM_01550 [Streptomyces sp. NPDC048604]|uniref:hypothetical protein n=1 Tax=Streptomyces sp. NPDC048604 TaxID=3365578 RepID=UPI00370FC9DF